MAYLVLLVLFVALAFGPQLWVRHVLARHAAPRKDFPGTGGELAQHLIDHYAIEGATVEETTEGDHYDPRAKAVRLSRAVHEGRSLTAVVTAAHEVGHAIQDHTGYAPLAARTRLAVTAMRMEKIGTVVIVGAPIVGMLTGSPGAGLLTFVGALLIMGTSVAVHMVTLPVEYDASFNKAMPILRACALTYVAASLSSLLNVARWIAILRR